MGVGLTHHCLLVDSDHLVAGVDPLGLVRWGLKLQTDIHGMIIKKMIFFLNKGKSSGKCLVVSKNFNFNP